MEVLTSFAALALVLSTVGIAGVVSYGGDATDAGDWDSDDVWRVGARRAEDESWVGA